MGKLGPVEWMLGASGVALVVAAVMDESPWGIVKEALTGSGRTPISKPRTLTSGAGDVGRGSFLADAVDAVGARISGGAGSIGAVKTAPADLVPIASHPAFKLRAAPAAAFVQWERVYGRPIELTGTYRSYAEQSRQYAADPNRFASPDSSAHVRGEAVDVDLAASGVSNPKRGDAQFDKLVAAAQAAGWCLSAYDRSPGSSKKVEPWHFSFFGCR